MKTIKILAVIFATALLPSTSYASENGVSTAPPEVNAYVQCLATQLNTAPREAMDLQTSIDACSTEGNTLSAATSQETIEEIQQKIFVAIQSAPQ